jgi:hypothetical protein
MAIDVAHLALPFGIGLIVGYLIHDPVQPLLANVPFIGRPAAPPMPTQTVQAKYGRTWDDDAEFEGYYAGDNMFPGGETQGLGQRRNFDREYTKVSETVGNVLPSITIA